MLVTPLALATIIGLAFGGISSGGGSNVGIQVALVNQDQPVERFGRVHRLWPDVRAGADPACGHERRAARQQYALAAHKHEPRGQCGIRAARRRGWRLRCGDHHPRGFYGHARAASGRKACHRRRSRSIQALRRLSRPALCAAWSMAWRRRSPTGNIAMAATLDALSERAATDPAFARQFAEASASGAFQPDFSRAFALHGAHHRSGRLARARRPS